MKCKILKGMIQDLDHLETQVNTITDNKSMRIVHIGQSQCLGADQQIWIVISIFWEWRDQF